MPLVCSEDDTSLARMTELFAGKCIAHEYIYIFLIRHTATYTSPQFGFPPLDLQHEKYYLLPLVR